MAGVGGLPDGWEKSALPELTCVLDMLTSHLAYREDLFTRRALERKTEWCVVRRLAAAALSDLAWGGVIERDAVVAAIDCHRRERRAG